MKQIFFAILATTLLFLACEKDNPIIEPEPSYIDTSTIDTIIVDSTSFGKTPQEVNTWIQEIMEEVYLWEAEIPSGLNPEDEEDPFTFFDNHVYEEEDNWSWLSDDYYETSDLYNGISSSSGMVFSLSLISDEYTVIGNIEYILPNTPAASEGIKRGDIFTKINNTTLNLDNYYELITKGGSYSMTFADVINNTLIERETKNITEIENYQENPVYIDSVYYIDGKIIGYLMYNGFINEFDDTEIERVFAKFKSENITDLIMDLRYNSGGDVSSEENLANIIAPTSALGEIFSKETWNDLYNQYWIETYGEEFLNTLIEEHATNINLTGKLIGLTTSSTASASEGLLNGLEPLLDFTQIGTTTHGKYTSMVVLPDDKDDPEWAIIPIVAKNTNKNGISVRNGMVPDYILNDNPQDGYALGNTNETMLAKAIEVITGTVATKSTKAVQTWLGEPIDYFHGKTRISAKQMYTDKVPPLLR